MNGWMAGVALACASAVGAEPGRVAEVAADAVAILRMFIARSATERGQP